MKARVRRAAPGDELTLSQIGAATFLETYAGVLDAADISAHCVVKHAPSFYAELLYDPGWRIFLAEAQTGFAPVGLVSIGPPLAGGAAARSEIHRLYVLHRFQKQRIGSALLRQAMQAARESGKENIIVGVNELNADALAFYETAGFERQGTRKFTIGVTPHTEIVFGLGL